MSKSLFTIDSSEKERILEMHQTATSRYYLGEQVVPATTTPTTTTTATTPTTTTPKSSEIPGFTWAEDTTSWISIESPTSNDLANEVKRSEENDKRMFEYYRTGELTGKIALVFKGLYLKRNLIHQFTIFSVKPSEKVVGAKYIYSSEKPVTPYLFVTKNNKSKYYANNLSAPEDVKSVLSYMVTSIYQTL